MIRQLRKNIINLIKKNDEIAYRLKALSLWITMLGAKFIDDRRFIEMQYKKRTGLELDLENPVTFNEKLQWIKLNYRNPLLNICVDKYAVRDYVMKKAPDVAKEILIPLIGVYNDVDEVDFKQLPERFIMKLTNGSSFNYICHNKTQTEIKKIKSRFNTWKKLDYYAYGREWAYKDVKNRIICEELLSPSSGNPPEDYRFFCFNGVVRAISVDIDSVVDGVKNSNYYRNIYDKQWNRIEAQIEYPNKNNFDVPKPTRLQDMIKIAEKLSEDFPAVRVDFYYFDDKFYFGELTFYHSSGYQKMEPRELATQLGSYINVDKLRSFI